MPSVARHHITKSPQHIFPKRYHIIFLLFSYEAKLWSYCRPTPQAVLQPFTNVWLGLVKVTPQLVMAPFFCYHMTVVSVVNFTMVAAADTISLRSFFVVASFSDAYDV